MKYIIYFLLYLVISSCQDESSHYKINCFDKNVLSNDYNSILFLCESANYQSLQKLKDTNNSKKYLTDNEFTVAFDILKHPKNDSFLEYKSEVISWNVLFKNNAFIAEIVLIKDNTQARGYYFQIRTYDNKHQIISCQNFATWSDGEMKFCSGDFSCQNQTFKVTCNQFETNYKFDTFGNIILEY